MKVAITLSVDNVVKKKAMKIIQQDLDTSVSAYVNDKFKELIESHVSTIKCKKEVKKCQI